MSTGGKNTYNQESGLVHHTNYDETDKLSLDYNPITGEVTRDHSVSNDDQD